VLVAHSFGTLLAYECAALLQSAYSFAAHKVVSLAGVSFEHLATLPIYQDNYDPHDKTAFEQRFRDEAVSIFGEVPDFVQEGHPSYNAAMKACTVQGKTGFGYYNQCWTEH
jgi:surfactin synthase thioesterase subunit